MIFLTHLKYEWRLIARHPMDTLNALAFFGLVILLFPLAVGSNVEVLRPLAPAFIWVAALLAGLLHAEHLFRSDYEDGTLALRLLSHQSLLVWIYAKLLIHWFFSGFILICLLPLMLIFFDLSWEHLISLVISLLLGTPLVLLISAIGSGLLVGLKKGGVLLGLLCMPLFVPVLIMALSVAMPSDEASARAALLWLMCFLVLGITLCPLAIAAALRIGTEQT